MQLKLHRDRNSKSAPRRLLKILLESYIQYKVIGIRNMISWDGMQNTEVMYNKYEGKL